MKRLLKKLPYLCLAAVLCVSAAACSGGTSDVPNDDSGGSGGNGGDQTTTVTTVDKSDLGYVDSLDSYKKTDWTAQWIWTESCSANSYVAFRKTFTVDSVPDSAVASIAAESKYYLWLNGELAVYDGSSKRGATAYDGYYEDIDLTDYLITGENTLVILVCYNGRSGNSSVDCGQAGLLFEMEVGSQLIVSDSSFKACRLKAYRNKSLLGADWPNYSQSSMLAEWDCYYDARESVGDYTSPDFDDSSWDNATVVGQTGAEPFNDTYLCVTPQMQFDKDYTYLESEYIGVTFTTDTVITIDLPENMQFSPYFELTASSAGLRFTYYTNTLTSQEIDSFKDDYVTVAGSQTYESYPWRSGSQLIIEVPAGITFTKIGFRRSGYDSEVTGQFTSDNEQLNTLWQKAANTLKICMRDTYMDCPERERSPYIGDSANQISETFYALDSSSWLMTKKTLLATVGWTKTDNCIPLRSPSTTTNECPAQTLNYLVSAYEYYLYTGDAETMRLFYPVAVNYLKLWELNSDGSIVYRSGTFQWVDWGSGIDNEVLQNCWYYYALSCTYKLADALGITDDEEFFTSTLASVKSGFSKFRKSGGYSSGSTYDDRANAMAVVSGLADESDYADIYNVLQTTYSASPYMEKFVLEALCMMGEEEYAVTRMLARFGDMINDSESTLWELWGKDEGTINHGWSGGALTVLSKYMGGIAPTSAGYESYDIKLCDLFDSLTISADTPKGTVSYSYTTSADGSKTITLNALTADGTLYIPSSWGTPVISGGEYAVTGTENGYTVITLKGGTYTITVA